MLVVGISIDLLLTKLTHYIAFHKKKENTASQVGSNLVILLSQHHEYYRVSVWVAFNPDLRTTNVKSAGSLTMCGKFGGNATISLLGILVLQRLPAQGVQENTAPHPGETS